MATEPVIHHAEMCCMDAEDALKRLEKFGFKLFAKRDTPLCKQLVAKLGKVKFVITERKGSALPNTCSNQRTEDWTTFCCEGERQHEIDSVFNISFLVTDIEKCVKKIKQGGGQLIQPITKVSDGHGHQYYCVVKSICGNVMHTLLQNSSYSGPFLVGFDLVDDSSEEVLDMGINYIDHVTLATHRGRSEEILTFYSACFGMKKFSISSNDDINNGLILEEGVGLRLRAIEYYRCSETGLIYCNEGFEQKERNPSTLMLVIVETLEGQTNCNVETFLNEHGKSGVEHIALSSRNIVSSVSVLVSNGVHFRKPPILYYEELRKDKEIVHLGKDLKTLENLGILLDLEEGLEGEGDKANKYLMQIFARAIFDRQTFFIEIIERCGSTGLGQGNILALVRSIREEERRKAVDAEKKKLLQARESAVAKNLETIRAT